MTKAEFIDKHFPKLPDGRTSYIMYKDIRKSIGESLDQLLQAEREAKWISVEDELPKDEEIYLVFDSQYDTVFQAYFNGSEFVSWDKVKIYDCCITHWQPLPQPPKDKQ